MIYSFLDKLKWSNMKGSTGGQALAKVFFISLQLKNFTIEIRRPPNLMQLGHSCIKATNALLSYISKRNKTEHYATNFLLPSLHYPVMSADSSYYAIISPLHVVCIHLVANDYWMIGTSHHQTKSRSFEEKWSNSLNNNLLQILIQTMQI